MKKSPAPTTSIAMHTRDKVIIKSKNLVDEIMGELTFTEMIYFHLLGVRPTPGQTKVLDAVLVTLMEHGFTPSSIVARQIYDSTPEAMQSAIAAGILGVGGTFIGTMEQAAGLLDEIMQAGNDGREHCKAIAHRYATSKASVPGFGHPFHKPDDPRTGKLFDIAHSAGVEGHYITALKMLSEEIDKAFGKHLTINVTGATAAVLAEIGIPSRIMRGLAVVSRSAGLVGHIFEEQKKPSARYVWDMVNENVVYKEDAS